MAKINCNVMNCSYNQGKACYASSIKIGGKSANDQEATCCGSFLNQTAYSNLAEFTSMRGDDSQIFCNVESCKYHQADYCNLDRILVGGNSNSLVYTETDCLSFDKK